MSVSVLACVLIYSGATSDVYNALGGGPEVANRLVGYRSLCEKEYGSADIEWLVDYLNKKDDGMSLAEWRKNLFSKGYSAAVMRSKTFKSDIEHRNPWMYKGLASDVTWMAVRQLDKDGKVATACLVNYSGVDISNNDSLSEHRSKCKAKYGVDVVYKIIEMRERASTDNYNGDAFSVIINFIEPLKYEFPDFYKQIRAEM